MRPDVSGAPVPRVLVQRAKAELGMDVLTIWGMTENGAFTMTRRSDPEDLVFGSDGLSVFALPPLTHLYLNRSITQRWPRPATPYARNCNWRTQQEDV